MLTSCTPGCYNEPANASQRKEVSPMKRKPRVTRDANHCANRYARRMIALLGAFCLTMTLSASGCFRREADPESQPSAAPLTSRQPIRDNPLIDEASFTEPEVSAMQEALRGKTVVLDPGHGFGDTGCPFPGSDLLEKDLTPVLAAKIREVLEADGVTVLLTHDGQRFPSGSELNAQAASLSYDLNAYLTRLVGGYSGRDSARQAETIATFQNGINDDDLFNIYERSYCANLLSAGGKHPADLFVSVHVNANENTSALSGFELYRCTDTPHAVRSRELIDALERGLQEAFPQTALRKIAWNWEEAFAVNKYTDMPSVLIESGYATNPTDEANLQNEAWQNAFARAVADGIELFLLEL